MKVLAICSNKPRPAVQRGAKGHQWWRRDTYHIVGTPGRTLCGIDASEWLVIGMTELNENCCIRCSRKVGKS